MKNTVAAAALCCLALSNATLAEDLTGTLKKVKDSGSITLGHREASIPLSYYDDKQNVIGYSQDLMLKAVDAIRREVKLDKLTIKMLPVTSQNRISLVQNGTVDLECGSTTNNTERQKQVAFSNSIFVIGTRLLVKKTSSIKDFADLTGKNVVTTSGTTSERLLRKMDAEKNMRMNIISAKDHGEAFLTLETGRAAAFMMDDALLYGELAKAKKPALWAVVGTPQSFEPYGCMMRKDDPQFKKVVDDALAKVMRSPEIVKIYNKWFRSPIPPKGLNLNFPMSAEVTRLFQNPNDKAFE